MNHSSIAAVSKSINLHTFMPSFKSCKVWVVIASYSFLGYKLLTFHQYQDLAVQWKQMPLYHFWWLCGVFILLPFNWYLESLKWKVLTAPVQKINTHTSVKAVLSGMSTGFFTPNRVGELVGRIAFLNPGNRKAGVTLSILNSLTQNIVMVLFGIPACILFFQNTAGILQTDILHFVIILGIGILTVGSIYFAFPILRRQLRTTKLSTNLNAFTDCLLGYNWKDLLQIFLVSILRYSVFSTQFYFMLRFYHVALTPWQAWIAIPTTYLFVTFTPSLAFSEAAVRSSYAVLIIGAFTGQVVNIALAGICIWAVNFVIPMLVGTVVITGKKI